MKSVKCDICNVVVHRASHAKQLRSKNHLENEMIIPLYKPLHHYTIIPKHNNDILR